MQCCVDAHVAHATVPVEALADGSAHRWQGRVWLGDQDNLTCLALDRVDDAQMTAIPA